MSLDTLWSKYTKLLASTASLPADLLCTTYLIDTGTNYSGVLEIEPDRLGTSRPTSGMASAAQGQCHQATHRATLNLPVVANDGIINTFAIRGVYYAEHARLNAVAPADLHKSGVTFKYKSDEPANTVAQFTNDGHRQEGQVIWIEQLPFLPTPALARVYSHNTANTPLAAAVLGSLPAHDYVRLVFDHASSQSLSRLWERSVGLIEKPLTFKRSVACHTCMETRNRKPQLELQRLARCSREEGRSLVHGPSESSQSSELRRQLSLSSHHRFVLIVQSLSVLCYEEHYNYTSRHPKFFQMDGAGGLTGTEISDLMKQYHISPRYSEPYDARPNGRAEQSKEMAVKYL